VASHLNRLGVVAEVIDHEALEDFVRRQAEQLLRAAQLCLFPDVRAEMEEAARTALAELERVERNFNPDS
jgi:hypothetical protein